MATHPAMNAQNAVQGHNNTWTTSHTSGQLASNPVMTIGGNGSMGIGTATSSWTAQYQHNNTVRLSVEKVDNGFILRSSKNEGEIAKVKICNNIDELKDLFVATLVEHQLEK